MQSIKEDEVECLTHELSGLCIDDPPKKRTLFGLADTEGSVRTSLWEFSVIFTHVVESDGSVRENIFHTSQVSINKNAQPKDVSPVLQSNSQIFDWLKDEYMCTDIILGFWNSSYDKKLLTRYQPQLPFYCHDMYADARALYKDKFPSLKLHTLAKQLHLRPPPFRAHTSMGDSLLLYRVCKKLSLFNFPHILASVHAAPTRRAKVGAMVTMYALRNHI